MTVSYSFIPPLLFSSTITNFQHDRFQLTSYSSVIRDSDRGVTFSSFLNSRFPDSIHVEFDPFAFSFFFGLSLSRLLFQFHFPCSNTFSILDCRVGRRVAKRTKKICTHVWFHPRNTILTAIRWAVVGAAFEPLFHGNTERFCFLRHNALPSEH